MFLRKSITIAGLLLTIIAASWTGANAQSQAATIVENWVNAARGIEFVTVSHDGIFHDDNTGVTRVSNLEMRFSVSMPTDSYKSDESNIESNSDSTDQAAKADGEGTDEEQKSVGKINYNINFPVVDFTDLQFDGEYYSARSISSDIAKLKFEINGTGTGDSDAVGSFENFSVENVRWARLPEFAKDADRPVSSYFPLIDAMLDMSFDTASVDSTQLVQNMGDTDLTFTTKYGRIDVGKTTRGNFSSMSAKGLEMETSSANTAASDVLPFAKFSIGNILAHNYNYRTMLEFFAPGQQASGDDDPYQVVLGEMIFDDINVTSKEVVFSLDHVVTSDVGMRASGIDILGEADRMIVDSKTGKQEPSEKQIIEMVGRIYAMFRLGLFELSGMKIDGFDAGKANVDTYRIADLSAKGMGEFLLAGMNFLGPKGELVNLDQLALSDLRFPSIEALLNLEEATKINDIAAIMKAIPTLASYLMKGIEINVPGTGNFSIAHSGFEMADFIGPVPTDVEIVVSDFKFPVKLMEREPREIFTAMGFDNVEISYDIKAKWQEATKILSLKTGAELKQGGILDINLDVGGVPRSIFENPLTAQSAVAFTTIDRADVKFQDRSIVDKGLALAGSMQGINAQTMKAQVVGMLPIMLQILEKPSFVDQVTAAVNRFLENKGSITATALPPEPVLILQLMGAGASAPGAVIDLLNVNVTSE